MARRRVFRTKIQSTDACLDVARTAERSALIGRIVTFEKVGFAVRVCMEGSALGFLDGLVGPQVAAAMDGGRSFKASIEKSHPVFDGNFKAEFFLKVEYLLESGQLPVEIPEILRPSASEIKPTPQSFFTKVAGMTHEGRQNIVIRCRIGETLMLVREPSNPVSSAAIKVMRMNGEQLGYIPEHVSREGDTGGLAYQLDRGDHFQCRIKDLTGGQGQYRGVNVEILDCEDTNNVFAAPPIRMVIPSQSHFGWVLFVCAVLALACFLVVIIRR